MPQQKSMKVGKNSILLLGFSPGEINAMKMALDRVRVTCCDQGVRVSPPRNIPLNSFAMEVRKMYNFT